MRHIQCTRCHGSFVVDDVPVDSTLKCPFCGSTDLSIPVPVISQLSERAIAYQEDGTEAYRPNRNPWSAAVRSLTGLCLGQLYNNQLRKMSNFLYAHIAVQSLLAVGAAWSRSVVWYGLMLGVLLLFVVGTAVEAFVSAARSNRREPILGDAERRGDIVANGDEPSPPAKEQ